MFIHRLGNARRLTLEYNLCIMAINESYICVMIKLMARLWIIQVMFFLNGNYIAGCFNGTRTGKPACSVLLLHYC